MRLVLPVLLSVWAATALADGSVEFADIRAMLHKQPAFEVLLTKTLHVESDGWGVRLGNHFEHLGGSRIGPYVFKGRPAGQDGPETLDITICTQTTFRDDNGRPTRDMFAATAVTEEVTSVIIREASARGYASCGEDEARVR